MTGFDYAAWVARAHRFVAGLVHLPNVEILSAFAAPPAREVELAAVERALGPTLPTSLRAFFAHGTAGLDCRYVFEPDGQARDALREIIPGHVRIYGGARLGPVSELPDFSIAVDEW